MHIKIVCFALPPALKRFIKIWHEAEKQNVAKAQFALAMLYSATKRESAAAKAVEWLKKAAKQKYTKAQFALGRCYENGYGVKQSDKQSVRWYKNAYHQAYNDLWDYPDPVAAAISECLQTTDWEDIFEGELDGKEDSFEFDEAAAEQGDAMAQQRLGHYYYYGQGTEQNHQQAVYWYHKSAEQGCEAAMGRLAEYYEKERNYKESARWYRNYAEQGIIYLDERRRDAAM